MRKIKLYFHIFFIFVLPVTIFSKTGSYSKEDIPIVMEKLFNFHVENKTLNETIMKRWIKIYIDQFDQEKIYLLEKEISPYLNMSSEQVKKVINRVNNGDYSDFERLSVIFNGAILRAKELRNSLYSKLIYKGSYSINRVDNDSFSSNMDNLIDRQTSYYESFFYINNQRSNIDSLEKKKKIVLLLNKKINRFEKRHFYDVSDNNNLFILFVLKGFAKSLDSHTTFFSNDEALEMRKSLEKEFVGLGIVLSEGVDGVMITDIIKKSPADNSNQINLNDVIVSIDNEDLDELAFDEVLDKLKKKDNKESITLTLLSNNIQKKVTLKWDSITINEERLAYTYEPYADGIIAKLTLNSFYDNSRGITSENDIKNAIDDIRKHGDIKGIILDLRDNAGGFLHQASKVAGIFISNGIVVVSKYSNQTVYLRSVGKKPIYNGPLIVLTSKLSASAAEIVAQALQDYGSAVIVGDTRTFGKGSIQYQTVTDAFSKYFFKVTVGKYFTVSGKSTQIEGVKADIVVPSVYASYNYGEKYLENPLKAEKIDPLYDDPMDDLDSKAKKWFKENYAPYLQKPVTLWKKMIPFLKENSERRLANDPNYQAFLKNEKTKENYGINDFQMLEAANIMKDMIFFSSHINSSK